MVEKWTTLLQNWSTLPCIQPICIDTWQFERPHVDDTWMKVAMDELTMDETVDKRWHHIIPRHNQKWNARMISGLYLAICKDGHIDQWLGWQLIKINSQIGQRAIGQKDNSRRNLVPKWHLDQVERKQLGTFWPIFLVKKLHFLVVRVKTKHIDDISDFLFTIGLNGLVNNSYMSITIRSYNVNGVGEIFFTWQRIWCYRGLDMIPWRVPWIPSRPYPWSYWSCSVWSWILVS